MATDDSAVGRIETIQELLGLTELTEIRTYVLHAERAERPEAEDAKVSISARGDTTWLEVRCRTVVATEEADLTVDRSALFTHAEPLDLSEELVEEFVERVGAMTVYPYLREGVFTLAGQLGIAPPVLALMRAGSVKVGRTKQEAGSVKPPVKVKHNRKTST